MTTLALVHGNGRQQDERLPAREQYISSYFGLKAEYAETICDEWVVLSEKHGLLSPTDEIAPYDASLDDYDARERSAWVTDLTASAMRFVSEDGLTSRFDEVVALTSSRYVELLSPLWTHLRSVGVEVQAPLAEQGGIATQQGWLRERIDCEETKQPDSEQTA
ncbi:DUF6884 domain-containing protein [Halorussus halophilus]|uniref:DUF6884 domain-containing protein n=1 Tax=Halorussus halophilus TaxID=2650975 RepID=UPI00130170D4|nr:DUF6884 domain-containing protein [Halorussus halophilus]